MSFNLNKNQDAAGTSHKTNFDLSKTVIEPAVPRSKGSRYGLYFFIGALLLGAAWYLTVHRGMKKTPGTDSLQAANTVQANTVGVLSDTGKVAALSTSVQDSTNEQAAEMQKNTGLKVEQRKVLPKELNGSQPMIAASFKPGSARFREAVPSAIINDILKRLNFDHKLKIYVFGYASSEGSLEQNEAISQARADAFKRLLVLGGVSTTRIKAAGKGIQDPIEDNSTERNRRKNRRVEVIIR